MDHKPSHVRIDLPTRPFSLDRPLPASISRARSAGEVQKLRDLTPPTVTREDLPTKKGKIVEKQSPQTPRQEKARSWLATIWPYLIPLLLLLAIARYPQQQGKDIKLCQRLIATKDEIHQVSKRLRNYPQAEAVLHPLYDLENVFSKNVHDLQDLGNTIGCILAPKFKSALKTGQCHRAQRELLSGTTSIQQSTATLYGSLVALNNTRIQIVTTKTQAHQALMQVAENIANVVQTHRETKPEINIDDLGKMHRQAKEWLAVVSNVVDVLQNVTTTVEQEIKRLDQLTDGLRVLAEEMNTERRTTLGVQAAPNLYCGAYKVDRLDWMFSDRIKTFDEND